MFFFQFETGIRVSKFQFQNEVQIKRLSLADIQNLLNISFNIEGITYTQFLFNGPFLLDKLPHYVSAPEHAEEY